MISVRDVDKFAVLLNKDIERVVSVAKGREGKVSASVATSLKSSVKRLHDTVAKMKKYLAAEVRKGH
jgi:hypothetical protein